MHQVKKLAACCATASLALVSPAFAGVPMGTTLSAAMGGAFPIGEGGLIGLVAGGVVAAIWLAKRKR